MAEIQTQTMLNADKNMEQQELALGGGGNAKWCSHPKDSLAASLKVQEGHPLGSVGGVCGS